ncbi:MAG: T9SS type A sorting domain-containing protein [Saprospiraceae bacterium]
MKKEFTHFMLLFGFICSGLNLQSQDTPYIFSHGNAPYVPLENATSITNGMTWDDPEDIIPIGFDFPLFSDTITELDFSFGLGASLAPPLGSGSTALIFAYDADLIDRGYLDDVSESEIVYLVEGAPGSRIFKIEWQNAGFYNELDENQTSNSFVNLQLWLYETSGVIEIRFGPSAIEDNMLVYDFVSGPLIGIIDEFNEALTEFGTLYYLVGEPDAPSVGVMEEGEETVNLFNNVLQGSPADGQWYRFDPLLVSASGEAATLAGNIRLFPQPVQGLLNVEFQYPAGSEAWQLQIFDALGQAVTPAKMANGSRVEMDVSTLPAGLYVLKASNEKAHTILRKMVKN